MEGLAALICNCDLVASISNATVHLAGALGKHAWILIPTNPQWYWHSSRDKSLWYPNIRLLCIGKGGYRKLLENYRFIRVSISLKI